MYTIRHFNEIDSTSSYIMRLAADGERSRIAVIADSQTSGRGRRGKSFYSSDSCGLYLSFLLPDRIPIDQAMFLTPMIACCVAKAIENLFGISVGIKWVNDLFLNGRKVAGILTETKFDFESNLLEYAVVGIGINLSEPSGGFPQEIKSIAGSLGVGSDTDTKLKLAETILSLLDKYLPLLGTDKLTDEYISRSILIGREINIVYADRTESAVVKEINRDCNLVVVTSDGEKVLSSGEVSIII